MIAGVSSKALSHEFGIPDDTIRQRASHENWPVPGKIEKLVKQAKQMQENGNLTVSHNGVSHSQKATVLTAETLQEQASAYSLKMFKFASKSALAGSKVVTTPDNWKSLDTADRMARRAAGLDKADSQSVTVNLGGWQAAVTAQGVTAQFREVEQVLADEDCAQEAQNEPEE